MVDCGLLMRVTSPHDEVNGVGSIPVWSGGMDFEEIGQKQNRSFEM